MEWAKIKRHGGWEEISAVHASRYTSGYLCPTCNAPVHLRAGTQRLAHFAHDSGTANPKCDEYHPALGLAGSHSGSSRSNTIPGPDRWESGFSTESITEPKILIEKDGERWRLLLEVPALYKREHANNSIQSLRMGWVQIRHRADNPPISISLLDLRPELGGARVPLEPYSRKIEIRPGGTWPTGIDKEPWNQDIEPLARRGTLFRLVRGEWNMIGHGGVIRWGERLLFLHSEPSHLSGLCGYKSLALTSGGATWSLASITLPKVENTIIYNLIKGLGYDVAQLFPSIKLMTWPLKMQGPRASYIIRPEDTVFLRIFPGSEANPDLSISIISTDTRQNKLFQPLEFQPIVEFSKIDTGNHRIALLPNGGIINLLSVDEDTIEIRKYLASLPKLKLIINDLQITPFTSAEYLCLRADEKISNIEIISMGLPVTTIVTYSIGRKIYRNRTASETAELILKSMVSKPTNIMIRAESLGQISLSIECTSIQSTSPNTRLPHWLSILSHIKTLPQVPLSGLEIQTINSSSKVAFISPTSNSLHVGLIRAISKNRKNINKLTNLNKKGTP